MLTIQENASLKNFNSFGFDVAAKYFVQITNLEDLRLLLSNSRLKDSLKMVLGGGSNVLISNFVDGLVLQMDTKGIELTGTDINHYYVKAQAGEVWDDLVKWAVENNYAGLENLSLIPGSVGASPIQNIGAYGVELEDVFYELEALNIETGEVKVFDKTACNFAYRSSSFKTNLKGKYIVMSVTFKLDREPKYVLNYGNLASEVERLAGDKISISAVREAVCGIRNSKLPDPKKLGNVGSFFKNPLVTKQNFLSLREDNPLMVGFEENAEQVKLAAGWLIDAVGYKGKRIADAGVHKDQALVLVNYGNAKGEDILALAGEIKKSVYDRFQVKLEEEVNIY